MSDQRLSALFPLHNFCSVANLTFKCPAVHIKLELMFDEIKFYENVWDWVSYCVFFGTLSKIFNFLEKF